MLCAWGRRARVCATPDAALLTWGFSRGGCAKEVIYSALWGQRGVQRRETLRAAFDVERYSHVMHIVSNVEGTLRPEVGQLDVLKATFPAGTLSGAPKVRAMELIDELEPVQRGIYGGACGYLSFAGDMDLAIAIRTGIVKNGMLYVQAAAGIVADSVPELEWQETEAKARALLRAAELVEEGF